MLKASQELSAVLVCTAVLVAHVGRGFGRRRGLRLRVVLMRNSRMICPRVPVQANDPTASFVVQETPIKKMWMAG